MLLHLRHSYLIPPCIFCAIFVLGLGFEDFLFGFGDDLEDVEILWKKLKNFSETDS